MRTYTTPTINITLRKKDGTLLNDFAFDYIIATMKNKNVIINRRIEKEDVIESQFDIDLTQEETSQLTVDSFLEIELNIFFEGDKRIATDIKTLKIQRNLLNKIIIAG